MARFPTIAARDEAKRRAAENGYTSLEAQIRAVGSGEAFVISAYDKRLLERARSLAAGI